MLAHWCTSVKLGNIEQELSFLEGEDNDEQTDNAA